MKKSTLFMACCIGLMLFASCKKDSVAPTINVFNGEGYATENTQFYSGNPITIGFVATGENLTQIAVTISQNGTTLASHSENIEKLANYNYSHTFTFDANGIVTITGIVTDAAGQTATKSFNVNSIEKPNAKFLGHYEGIALATGSIEAEFTGIGMQPVQDEFTDREVPVILDLAEGENMNEVVGTCKMNDREITCKGTVEGNKLVFEAVNDIVTFSYDLGLMTVNPEINVTYTIVATLDGNQLDLEGTCTGDGDLNYGFVTGTIKLQSMVGGSLNKQ